MEKAIWKGPHNYLWDLSPSMVMNHWTYPGIPSSKQAAKAVILALDLSVGKVVQVDDVKDVFRDPQNIVEKRNILIFQFHQIEP